MATFITAENETFRTKKRFGQNFLRDTRIVDAIVAAAGLTNESRVLEIGPGLGALTDRLLEQAGQVAIIELDPELISYWQSRGEEKLTLCPGDALRLDWPAILTDPPYVLAANLPYNISTQILFKMIENRQLFSRFVLMFQKEVGERLAAGPGTKDYGVLSVLTQLWFDVRKVVAVPPSSFSPPPKVHSLVVALEPLAAPRVALPDERVFRRVVKGAFGQRRKTLRNALGGAGYPPEVLDAAFAATGIDPVRRGETLDLEEFSRLSCALLVAESAG